MAANTNFTVLWQWTEGYGLFHCKAGKAKGLFHAILHFSAGKLQGNVGSDFLTSFCYSWKGQGLCRRAHPGGLTGPKGRQNRIFPLRPIPAALLGTSQSHTHARLRSPHAETLPGSCWDTMHRGSWGLPGSDPSPALSRSRHTKASRCHTGATASLLPQGHRCFSADAWGWQCHWGHRP